MSPYLQLEIRCPACGTAGTAPFVESTNTDRDVGARAAVLAGTFQRYPCANCRTGIVLEQPCLYTDPSRHLQVYVMPSAQRPRHAEHVGMVREVLRQAGGEGAAPIVRAVAATFTIRLVFGYDELREKVLCAEHGLDDRILEVVKLRLLDEGLWGSIVLFDVASDGLHFLVAHRDGVRTVVVEHAFYRGILGEEPALSRMFPVLWGGPYVHVDVADPVTVSGEPS